MTSALQRVRADLELVDLRRGALAGFAMERRAVAVGRPQRAALPAGIRVVDATVDPLGEEAERIRNAHVDPLAVDERHQRLVAVARGQRHVVPEAGRVLLVDPGVVARLGAAALGDILELRTRKRRKRPALGAQLAFSGLRAVERALALAAVERAEMAARQRHIRDAVAVDVEAARPEARERRLI